MQRFKATDIIDEIITTIELAHVPKSEMEQDVRRMGFKVKPISGDIAIFEKIRMYFLKPLWKMGRVDEIVQKHIYKLTHQEKEILFDFLEEFELKTQADFNHQLIKKGAKKLTNQSPLRLEVFKESSEVHKLVN